MSQAPWQAAAVETRAVSGLLPYANNARTHSPEQVEQLAASIAEFGFTVPVLVDERGVLVAGHGRVLAAQVARALLHVELERDLCAGARARAHAAGRAGVCLPAKNAASASPSGDAGGSP